MKESELEFDWDWTNECDVMEEDEEAEEGDWSNAKDLAIVVFGGDLD